MITVVSGTNRANSKCLIFAEKYVELLQQHTDEEVALIALEKLPQDWMHVDMYDAENQSDSIVILQDKYIFPADKFLFVLSEYNGSFPGVVKLFIDTLSVREYPRNFKGKKVALAGVGSGRAGNLRGMGHFTHVLNHVGAITMPSQMPYSSISLLLKDGEIIDQATLNVIEAHAKELIEF